MTDRERLALKIATVASGIIILVVLGLSFYIVSQSRSDVGSENHDLVLETVKYSPEEIITGLTNPWDVKFLPSGDMLFTQRGQGLFLVTKNAGRFSQPALLYKPDDLYISGEGGMLSLAVGKDFDTRRELFACFNSRTGTGQDVRVARLELSADAHSVVKRTDIVKGIPSNVSGRHSGCRLAMSDTGELWIGTGDAALAENPQSKSSLGGKILRVDRDGLALAGNLGSPFDPRIFSYGHRNTQGIVIFDKQIAGSYGLSAEHGPDRDDEVNLLKPGNFGWAPISTYDELVPMTDLVKFPQAISSVWSSGSPTVASSGLLQIKGAQWGAWEGTILMATLKGEHIEAFALDGSGKLTDMGVFLQGFGRIRSLTQAANGDIYFTTDNGYGNDKIVRIKTT